MHRKYSSGWTKIRWTLADLSSISVFTLDLLYILDDATEKYGWISLWYRPLNVTVVSRAGIEQKQLWQIFYSNHIPRPAQIPISRLKPSMSRWMYFWTLNSQGWDESSRESGFTADSSFEPSFFATLTCSKLCMPWRPHLSIIALSSSQGEPTSLISRVIRRRGGQGSYME